MSNQFTRSGTMVHRQGRIILDLPIDEVEDIAAAFSPSDGFSRDLRHLVEEARSYIDAVQDGPGIRIGIVDIRDTQHRDTGRG